MSEDQVQTVQMEDAATERERWKTRSRYAAFVMAFCALIIGYYTLHDKESSMHQSNLDSAWSVMQWTFAWLVLGRGIEYVMSLMARRGGIAGIIAGGQQTVVQSGSTRVEVNQKPPQGGA